MHDPSAKLLALALVALGLEVFEVGSAEFTAERVDMEIDVIVPFVVKSPQQMRSDRASFRATRPLKFPDFRQDVFEVGR